MDPRFRKQVKLTYNHERGYELPTHARLFIKGPIDIDWLGAACRLPGKTVHVALAIHWLAGMKGSSGIKVSRKALQLFHVSNDANLDALRRLGEAGLISYTAAVGQRALITVKAHQRPDCIDASTESPRKR
jgi:hypothetical protein